MIFKSHQIFCISGHTNGGIIFSDGKAEDNEDLQGRVKTFIFSQDGSKIAWIKSGQ